MVIHAFFAAASSVLSSLAQNPMSPNASSDLALVKPFLRLLETLTESSSLLSHSEELVRMRATCNRLNNEAKEAVQFFRFTASASSV